MRRGEREKVRMKRRLADNAAHYRRRSDQRVLVTRWQVAVNCDFQSDNPIILRKDCLPHRTKHRMRICIRASTKFVCERLHR